MILKTLIENLVYQRGLTAEHGLSIHIRDGNTNILFDTGQGANFITNAALLGIDISEVDYLVISHGHYDHIGGLPAFLEANSKARVILKREAMVPKYHGNEHIGLKSPDLLPAERITFADKVMQVTENVYIMPEIQNFFPIDNHKQGFYCKTDTSLIPDNFDDELFIAIKSAEKIHILSSCSHNGITNIIELASKYFNQPIESIIGGFHTKNAAPEIIEHITGYFNQKGIDRIGICHCTGVDNYIHFKEKCSAKIFYNYTGTQLII